MSFKIGIMQGRLSKPTDGKIQSFPKNSWENEFYLAKKIGFELIEWVIDEDLKNYREMYTWMTSLGFPREYGQFSALQEAKTISETASKYSDMSILLHTNKSNPNYQIKFTDVFPTSLSAVQFDTTASSLDPIVVDATFAFQGMFDIEKIVRTVP